MVSIVCSMTLSQLDYCNSHLYGLHCVFKDTLSRRLVILTLITVIFLSVYQCVYKDPSNVQNTATKIILDVLRISLLNTTQNLISLLSFIVLSPKYPSYLACVYSSSNACIFNILKAKYRSISQHSFVYQNPSAQNVLLCELTYKETMVIFRGL